MMMKNIFIGTETVRMGAFNPVQKLYSFLDIPYAVLLPAYLYRLVAQVTGWFNVGLPLTNVIQAWWKRHSVLKTTLIVEYSASALLLLAIIREYCMAHICAIFNARRHSLKWWSHE